MKISSFSFYLSAVARRCGVVTASMTFGVLNAKRLRRRRPSIGALVCMSAMLACCAIPARAQVMLAVLLEPGDIVLAPIGGSGGGGFDARCPKGELLSGFDLRAADDVDSIAPLCRPAATGRLHPYPSRYGGDGGSPHPLVCPSERPIVTGMFIGYEGAKTLVVNNVHLYCGVAATSQPPSRAPDAAFDGPPAHVNSGVLVSVPYGGIGHDLQNCPTGLVGVGIQGRSGVWLDAVGLICGLPPANDRKPSIALGRPTASAQSITEVPHKPINAPKDTAKSVAKKKSLPSLPGSGPPK